MTSPFDGTLLWIWNLPNCDGGDPARIVARLQSVGAAGAIIKATDAGHGFNDWQSVKAVVAALKAAGLSAVTWGYCYNADTAGEANAAIQAIQDLAPSAHVFDVEQECEDSADPAGGATVLVSVVAAACPGVPLAYAPLPSIRNHLRLPYYQLTSAGLAMLPQLYWVGLQWTPGRTVSEFYADATQYGLKAQPIYPAYEDAPLDGAGATAADLATFLAAVKFQGATGISVWSYEHLNAAGWTRVMQATQAFPAPVQPPVDPCQAVKDALVAMTAERDALALKIQSAERDLA